MVPIAGKITSDFIAMSAKHGGEHSRIKTNYQVCRGWQYHQKSGVRYSDSRKNHQKSDDDDLKEMAETAISEGRYGWPTLKMDISFNKISTELTIIRIDTHITKEVPT
jgi:hypothetical protein